MADTTSSQNTRGRASSAFSASLLLMVSALLSGVLGLVRGKLIAHFFGVSGAVDAYTGAFQLPDTISYLLIGGVASTTFVKLLTQYENEGRQTEGDLALSNVLNVMTVVLSAGLVLAGIFAPQYVRYVLELRNPETAQLCVQLTRILLVNQLLGFAGGIFGSRLLVRKIFIYQAVQPLLYNGGIIAGAILLHARFGVHSLAYGAVVGAFFGFFLTYVIGAYSIGMRWSPIFNLRDPALREWVKLSLPLMLGQSLVTLDPWIRNHFAGHTEGAISLMSYSRQLFNAPMNIIGPAAGAASLPFFASLWLKDKSAFNSAVNRSVSRLLAVSLLLTSVMIALAQPIIDVALRGGKFHGGDASAAASLFVLFCYSLVFWASQNLYARAFYAVGNTLTPMISGTVVTVLSLPVYALLFRTHGIAGLVIASDIGIAAHMIALAVLLNRKGMVRVADLEWSELGKSSLAAILGGCAAAFSLRYLPQGTTFVTALLRLATGTAAWLVVVVVMLLLTRSALPAVVLRRKRKPASAAAPLVEASDAPDR
ncbi:murein biosynthesis integral membrane protein MurJ [Terriglobus sp. TAA 43]|uniref:murein biosynthesis integral membrane protein MurJ n=1 Tax=Terriglobus sp. TAA 43 TaxID=278961 RepID=UPI0006904F58|nr:lipid II flippase MurJ [Terriglobus sp. TAA 43]